MFANVDTGIVLGVVAQPVRVEARVERGLPSFTIVGLRDRDARACRERVRCGFRALGLEFPLARVTVNLAPADLPKQGAGADLPVLLAVLAAAGEIRPEALHGAWAYAELGLDGALRAAPGVLAVAASAAREHAGLIIVDEPSAPLAAHLGTAVVGATSIRQIADMLEAGVSLPDHAVAPADLLANAGPADCPDLVEVRGQDHARRALEIAAAGSHNLLMYGPPGCGKTMLASRLGGVLPPLSGAEHLEVRQLFDAAGQAPPAGGLRPFRNPHHTITGAALVGGGSTNLQIGEVTLAHRGVLFLDELPEFRPAALEALREPIESGVVSLRRAGWAVEVPARTQVVAAMNLCRCGRLGSTSRQPCECPPAAVEAYRRRVSGPLLNRFEIAVAVTEPAASIATLPPGESSATVAERVARARTALSSNPPQLTSAAAMLLDEAACMLALAGRTQAGTRRVAGTIAALDGREVADQSDVEEALTLRAQLPNVAALA